MLRDRLWKFTWAGIIVLGVMLLGMPVVYAGDLERDPADVAYQEAMEQQAADLEEIAANRDAVIEELVQMWFMDEQGWEEEFRLALSGANDSELLAIQNAKSYAEVQAILSGGTPDDFSAASLGTPFVLGSENYDFVYAPVNPCRIIDTRVAGGKISTNTSRDFYVNGGGAQMSAQGGNPAGCSAPRGEPRAVHMNIVAVNSDAGGWLTVWPKGTARPLAGVLNYAPGKTDPISNAFTVKTGFAVGHDISVYARQTTHVVADVMGYYYDAEPEKITALNGQSSTSQTTLGTTYTTLMSKTIYVPYSGGIMLTGSASFIATGVDVFHCKFTENGTQIDTWFFGGIPGTQSYHTSRTIARPVVLGTKTYAMLCGRIGGTSGSAHNKNLTMLFVKEGM